MAKKSNTNFQDIEGLKKSIKRNKKKCDKLTLEIEQAQEALNSISHLEHSAVSKERLQFLDAKRHLYLLKHTLEYTQAMITCQVIELEKQTSRQNEFQSPVLSAE